jgi:hypothetical protein
MPGYLAMILEDMLAEAKAKMKSYRKLKNGLHIEISVQQVEVTVTLGRDLVEPSVSEWDTVMKNFPYNTPKTIPTPSTRGNRLCITGKVPTQRAAQMKFG